MVVCHIRLEDVDVGTIYQVLVRLDLGFGTGLVANNTDNNVLGVFGVLAEELVLDVKGDAVNTGTHSMISCQETYTKTSGHASHHV